MYRLLTEYLEPLQNDVHVQLLRNRQLVVLSDYRSKVSRYINSHRVLPDGVSSVMRDEYFTGEPDIAL